ncbi:unnamed protein product [Withania somnifera]
MNNHMLRMCPKRPAIVQDNSQKLLNLVPFSKGAKDGVVSTWKFDQAQSRRALAQMVIVDELPFSFVEKEGFKNFMKVTVPQFHIPSRRTLTRDCYVLYGEQRKLLKKVFKEARPKICLTTGVDMAASITKCLLDWGLDNVFTITVDNASSNDVTVAEMSKRLNVPTRWNSTYLMLETAQYFELAFERFSFYDNGYLDYVRTCPCEDGTCVGVLTSEDWDKVRSMITLLETFYELTLKVSGSKYVTNNVHLVEIGELDLILKEMTRKRRS